MAFDGTFPTISRFLSACYFRKNKPTCHLSLGSNSGIYLKGNHFGLKKGIIYRRPIKKEETKHF